jgi:alkylresorcinol/alkylpyrone synthase
MPTAAFAPKAALISLATSLPPNVFLQKDVLAAAWEVFGSRLPQFETLSSILSNTGIIKRHGVKPFEWYLERRGWPERTAAFLEGAEALFVDAAEKALASAQLSGNDIDTVVTICSTGIATPSLEARVAGRLRFRSDVSRVPVFGLGCAGGVPGPGAAEHQCALGRRRTLLAGASARRIDQSQYRRHQPVRGRRSRDDSARR